jgi:hypothetical protein
MNPLQQFDTVPKTHRVSKRAKNLRIPLEPTPFGPRPFYVMSHNPNTLEEVRAALKAGANALAPDINVYIDDPERLCISHNPGLPSAPTLEQYLQDLHAIAQQPDSALSLVIFDCKPSVSTPEFGLAILTAIRKYLTYDTELNILLTVAKFDQVGIFDHVKHQLGPREGIGIDEEDDIAAVADYFNQAGVSNQCFGDGISIGVLTLTAPDMRPAMERACALRAASDHTKLIYPWTINKEELMQQHVDIGVDGIITDDIEKLAKVVKQNQSVIRMATRDDNPLKPANFAYSLTIHTGDVYLGGTDARLTFTLNGTSGSAKVTVDASVRFRMERNDWNYVTLYSNDLGELQSITVQRDNQGLAPNWFLDMIKVESFRYKVCKEAIFNCWIDSTEPLTQSFE